MDKKELPILWDTFKNRSALVADYLELTIGIIDLLAIDDKVTALETRITELCDTILVSQTNNKGGSNDEERMEWTIEGLLQV